MRDVMDIFLLLYEFGPEEVTEAELREGIGYLQLKLAEKRAARARRGTKQLPGDT